MTKLINVMNPAGVSKADVCWSDESDTVSAFSWTDVDESGLCQSIDIDSQPRNMICVLIQKEVFK